MAATVLIDTDAIELPADDAPVRPRRPVEDADRAILNALAARYAALEQPRSPMPRPWPSAKTCSAGSTATPAR